MMHPSQHEPATPAQISECERNRPFMRMYGALLEYGIGLFEPNGIACGVGPEVLELLLHHFTQLNSPGRCKYIESLILKYKDRWPYRQANYSVN